MLVNLGGEISVPLVGYLAVEGKTIGAIETEVREALTSAVYRQRLNGDELLIVIRPDEVSIEVAEFRPIYIMGSVVRSGEVRFRPNMTARQAASLAGGIVPPPEVDNARVLQLVQLRAENAALLPQYVRSAADVLRLKAEVAGVDLIEYSPEQFAGVSAETIDEILALARERLTARLAFLAGEKRHLESAIQQNGQRIAVLREQQRQEQEGVDADAAEFARVQALADQQSVQQARVTEARRQLLMSSTRALQTKSELATVEIRQEDLIRQLERLDEQRRVELLADLAEAQTAFTSVSARIDGALAQISLVADDPAQPVEDAELQLTVRIYRNSASVETRSDASMDAALLPGDVVEFTYIPAP
jgi:polysaccharide export outer membrane protein